MSGYSAYRSLCSKTAVSSFSHLSDVMAPAAVSALARTYRYLLLLLLHLLIVVLKARGGR